MKDSREVNRALWNERAAAHAKSPDYQLARFLEDPAHLSNVVRFDRPRLGEIRDLHGVHLQCHIGTDTISLARLGAHMSGLDFSPAALEQARRLSESTGAGVRFVQSDLYDAVEALGANAFDFVFTGVGALCWLPDIRRWARVVAGLLRPGGRLFLREGHPMLWALADPRPDGLLVVEHPYFERADPTIWTTGGTYVQTDATFTCNESHEWNHGLGEILTALLDAGMAVSGLVEHDSAPWNALPGQMECGADGEWRLIERPWRVPMTYTLQAIKRT